MRAFLFLILMTLSAFAQFTADGDYVVTLFDQTAPSTVANMHRVTISRQWRSALRGFAAHMTAAQANRLAQDSRVQFIDPDLPVQALAQTVPTGIRRIGTQYNATANIGAHINQDVDIAIIDTGIDLTHPDLRVFQNVTFVTNTITGNDDNGHGTHCAGIAAAIDNDIGVVGVCPGARLWAVKVLDSAGSGALSTIISGVDYVTQHASEIEIASMSLGGQGLVDSLRYAIQNSIAKGVVYVVAAGNSDFDVYGSDIVLGNYNDFFPASYPEVMTISAINDTDGVSGGLGPSDTYGLDDTTPSFSNFSCGVDASNPVYSKGAAIDLAAPGVNIFSTYKNGTYATLSGTSMACPHAAGAVGLYIVSHARATTAAGVYAIRQALIDQGQPQSEWGINPIRPPDHSIDNYPEYCLLVGKASTAQYPTVTISSPVTGSAFTITNLVTLTGTATDLQDGTISANIRWYSNINGSLGIGASISPLLSNGSHSITAQITDSTSLSASTSIAITVNVTVPNTATNAPPTVVIIAPANGATYAQGTLLTFTGTATDVEDGTISSSLQWYSNLNGPLGTGASISTSTLSPGTHTITANVVDSGALSGSASITLYILTLPPPPAAVLTALVTTDRASYLSKMKATIRCNVKADGVNTSGATVAFTLSTPNGRQSYQTLTSDSSGNVTWVYNVNTRVNGTGTYTITARVTKSGATGTTATATFTGQ